MLRGLKIRNRITAIYTIKRLFILKKCVKTDNSIIFEKSTMRRQTTIPILLFLFLIVFGPLGKLHAQHCMPVPRETNYYCCGIRSGDFQSIRCKGTENKDHMYLAPWSAAIQMILGHNGLKLSQQDIVARIANPSALSGETEPGIDHLVAHLNSWTPGARQGFSAISAYAIDTSLNNFKELLSEGWPVLVALRDRENKVTPYVLTTLYYSKQYDALENEVGLVPDKVILFNPGTDGKSTIEMNWEEFKQQCYMAMNIWLTRI